MLSLRVYPVGESHSVVSDSLRPHGLYSPWNSPGQNIGVGSHSLLQGMFPTQGSNPGLPHCGRILYQLSHKGSPRILEWAATWTRVSCIAGGFFTNWDMRETQGLPSMVPIHMADLLGSPWCQYEHSIQLTCQGEGPLWDCLLHRTGYPGDTLGLWELRHGQLCRACPVACQWSWWASRHTGSVGFCPLDLWGHVALRQRANSHGEAWLICCFRGEIQGGGKCISNSIWKDRRGNSEGKDTLNSFIHVLKTIWITFSPFF